MIPDSIPAATLIRIAELRRSGYLIEFKYASGDYSLGTFCQCPDITLDVAGSGQPLDYLNVTVTCAAHGAHKNTASRCPEFVHIKSAAFAWVEQRHARDRRAGWGMPQRRTP